MSVKTYSQILITFISFSYFFIAKGYAQDNDAAANVNVSHTNFVILQYHHVANNSPNSTSVTPAVFEEHMAYIAASYNVISLEQALNAIKSKEALPEKTIVITFDDGYTNILQNAHPILERYQFPYTVFINPAIIGESNSQLDWEQIKQMQPLASFANHTLDHAHLLEKYGNENDQHWLTRVMRDINEAEAIIKDKLGYSKKWFAYPFGEFNQMLKSELLTQGYIAFGQQSGAVNHFSDFGALPRFPASGIYGKLDGLKVKLNTIAMPVKSVTPNRVQYKPDEVIDELVLEIEDKDVRLSAFACYFKGEKLKFMGNDDKIVVKVNHTTRPGRARINCTAPSNNNPKRYYWYSYPMFTATHDGEFLN